MIIMIIMIIIIVLLIVSRRRSPKRKKWHDFQSHLVSLSFTLSVYTRVCWSSTHAWDRARGHATTMTTTTMTTITTTTTNDDKRHFRARSLYRYSWTEPTLTHPVRTRVAKRFDFFVISLAIAAAPVESDRRRRDAVRAPYFSTARIVRGLNRCEIASRIARRFFFFSPRALDSSDRERITTLHRP